MIHRAGRHAPEPVPQEIISTVIALAAWSSTSLTIAGIGLGTVLTGIAVTANFALQAINRPRQGGGGGIRAAAGINAPEARGSVQQSAPIQRWIYGRVRTGGAVFFLDDSKPPWLYLGLLLSDRQISGIRGLHISTNDIKLSSSAFNAEVFPLPIDGQIYNKAGVNRLSMAFGAGLPSQAKDPILTTDFPNLEASFRQQGIARAVFKFKYGDDAADFQKMWGQGVSIPNPLLDIEGTPVFDPRDPSQFYPTDWRDADQVAAAMATWKYVRNGREVGRTSSLVQADYLGHPGGVNYPPGRIRWDEIARGAEFDEEPVANKDGTSRPRGTIDGVITQDQTPRSNLEAMLATNQGFVVQSRGRGWVQPLRPRTPVLTIDDSMMLGGFDFEDDREKNELVNIVQARYCASEREYQDTDAPSYKRADLIALDGEKLIRNIRLPLTGDHRAVQQIEKQYLELARLKRALTCVVKLRALADDIDAGACVQVWSRLYPMMNALYEVKSMGVLDDFSGLALVLREFDPDVATRWNAQTDEQDFILPALNVS